MLTITEPSQFLFYPPMYTPCVSVTALSLSLFVYVYSGSESVKKNSEIYAEWLFNTVVNIWVKEKIYRKDQ